MSKTPSMGILSILLLTFIYHVASSSNKDSSSTHSVWIADNLPRYNGHDTLTKEDVDQLKDDRENSAWLRGIIGLAAIMLIVPILSLIICPFWMYCRVCECWYCERWEPDDLEKVNRVKYYWAPFAFIILLLIVMIIFTGLAYVANGEFSDILLYRNHDDWKNHDEKDLNLFDIAYGVSKQGSTLMDKIQHNVSGLKPQIDDAITGVKAILEDADSIKGGVDELTTMVDGISTKWNGYSINNTYKSPFFDEDVTTTFDCIVCKVVGLATNEINDQIVTKSKPIFDDLNETITELESQLIDAQSDIDAGIDHFDDQIGKASDRMDDIQSDLDDKRHEISDYNDQRELSFYILFVVALIPLLFIVSGGIMKRSFCFTIAYSLLWLSMVIMFILLAIYLPAAAAMDDFCGYTNMVDKNVTFYYNSDVGKVLASCLENTKLTSALGLDKELNFTIVFPTFKNVTSNFNFSELTKFNDFAQRTNESTFYLQGNVALEMINSMTSTSSCATEIQCDTDIVWTRTNFKVVDINDPMESELHPDNYYDTPADQEDWDTLATAIDILYSENEVSGQFTTAVNDYQTEIQAVVTKKDEIAVNAQTVTDEANAAEDLLDPVFKNIDRIEDSSRCGFVGDGYYAFRDVLCQDMMDVMSSIIIAMIVVAAMSFVGCVCSFKMVRRSYWLKKESNESYVSSIATTDIERLEHESMLKKSGTSSKYL